MSTKNAKILLKKSSVQDKVASASDVVHGELLLNYNNVRPMLEFKDSANAIQVLDIKKCQQASDSNPTLSWGTKSKVATVNGVDINVTMPSNPNTDTNTTYAIATGDNNGQIKVTPSSGGAYNVSVKGLGSGAYTSAYSLPTASSTTLGGVKSAQTGTTTNRNYNVQVNSDGTMKVNVPWTDTNTTYSNATSTSAGLMSAADKTKLDGIASGANVGWKAKCIVKDGTINGNEMDGYDECTWISTTGSLTTPGTSSTFISVDGVTGGNCNEINIIKVNSTYYMRATKKT
ncbi:MAG: hypothetical protein K2H20_02275 [Bacilli bacterium]|nr:hypothetical protein [Bacilli bacterium]